jgi:hypothetical protein
LGRKRSGGADAREDGLPEIVGPGELRPVARGQVGARSDMSLAISGPPSEVMTAR